MTQPSPLLAIPEQDLVNVVLTQTSAGVSLRGWHRGTGRWVSIKLLSVTTGQQRWWKRLLEDISLVKRVPSERLLVPLGFYGACPHLGLVSEWMDKGSLHSLLYEGQQYPDLPVPLRIRILFDVAEGLSHLHSIPLLHLALRPTNVLLDQKYRAKVCDWGQWSGLESGSSQSARNVTCIRDLVYLSPEVIRGDPPSKEADVYSFGIMMLETLNRKLPCEGACSPQGLQSHVIHWAQRGMEPVEQALSQLIHRCCSSDLQRRPSAAECMQELRKALAVFDSGALVRAVLQLQECKERAMLGSKDQPTLEMKVEINNLELYDSCRHPKSAYTKTMLLNTVQGSPPDPQIPNHFDTSRQTSSSSSSGKSGVSEWVTSVLSSPNRLRSHSALQQQTRADQQRSASPHPVFDTSSGLRHHCRAVVSGKTCCQILRERRDVIVQRMTEGRLNNLLDVLRARRALGREEYELITAALTLAGRTRSLLDTCLCLGEHVAILVVSTLGLVSAAAAHSPSWPS